MDKLIIEGGHPLRGKVRVSGAKNASLALLCGALLAEDEVILENVPDISDVRIILEIIGTMGAKVRWLGEDILSLKSPDQVVEEAPYNLVKQLRASNLLLGPMLARYGKANVSLPGGCNIGVRPMDLHFKGLVALGADLSLERGAVRGSCKSKGFKGTRVYLDFPSVGATENIMMAAVLAEGQTVIENVAKEPEIVDLANFLNSLGARVRGAGTDLIKIEGVPRLKGGRYSIIPDRIEAGTFMVAAAATRGDVLLENVIPRHLEPLSAKLREANVEVIEGEDSIHIKAEGIEARNIDIKTMPYPGFPTDMQSQMMALLSTVPGTSIIIENIFENRFRVADELKRMGANIKVEGRMAVIEGVPFLQGTQVKASDLRAGAALVISGLMARGETEIGHIQFVDRGYAGIEQKLNHLGACIRRA
ncbi:UDP-N-acetylglucosamine 1-carboxyvinyltransferase [Desulforamulus ruminis]|uniref:UDP-N-acetylglucosamine 1-carboxyvinyltransferase n=1 Tax=Desulforamulus ruminis (strain ATCC 23193 / DSM 2154 / NCIMB 8452 / DL) TaxID=696281 RepID=F6DQS1_DESRL|nr:UDP-N-acetylglucosamine 1-carboxyvinyltransferase [Desulforamulus ruminis]AEG62068.1 UDP-N-acetylglucosamine 1-carboxyvinyltransferase [Desulforamulus ruminis DSM 2154]